MKQPRKSAPREESGEASDRVLRAKYLDYCSAKVADLLLRLTPDEMYLLAQDAARELESDEEPLSYTEIVRLSTDRISRKLAIPDFPAWLQQYRRDPQRFENELLGLWEAEMKTTGRGAS